MNDVTYEASYDDVAAGRASLATPTPAPTTPPRARVYTVTGRRLGHRARARRGRARSASSSTWARSTRRPTACSGSSSSSTARRSPRPRCGIGYLHTGIEKNLEYRTWTQGVTFVTRMDYLAPMSNEAALLPGVEKLLGIVDEIPERAQLIRVITLELNRISSHLVALATGGMEMGALTGDDQRLPRPRAGPRHVRDDHRAAHEQRLHPPRRRRAGHARGRRREDPRGAARSCRKQLDGVPTMLVDNGIWMDRTSGIGYLDLAGCMALGITGPVLRADRPAATTCARRSPTSATRTFDFDVPTDDTVRRLRPLPDPHRGDQPVDADHRAGARPARARAGHGRRQEDRVARAALDRRRRPGQLPRPHPPHHGRVDGGADPPLQAGHRGLPGAGRSGLRRDRGTARRARRATSVSDGGTRPYRVHFRDPSFNNLQAIAAMCEGGQVADVVGAVACIDPVMGGVDR